VVDLGERLGLGATVIGCESRLLIASVHGYLVALIIECVADAIVLEGGNLHVPSAPYPCIAAVGSFACNQSPTSPRRSTSWV
jgi:hypothetical protein